MVVLMEGVQLRVSDLLAEWSEVSVEAHLHHYPPQPVDKTLPGGGSCLWNGHCPHGHEKRPGWLFNQNLTGTVALDERGWCVGSVPFRFDLMEGHYGRLIVLSLSVSDTPPDSGPPRCAACNDSGYSDNPGIPCEAEGCTAIPPKNTSSEGLLDEAGQMVAFLETLKGIIND